MVAASARPRNWVRFVSRVFVASREQVEQPGVQAFNRSVSLPVAGYNYNSDWTPLLAGLQPLEWQLASLTVNRYRSIRRWSFNRRCGVKRFQTIRRRSADVAHGLVLLFVIGTKAVRPIAFELSMGGKSLKAP